MPGWIVQFWSLASSPIGLHIFLREGWFPSIFVQFSGGESQPENCLSPE